MKKRLLSGLLSGIMMLSALTCVPALAASGETPAEEENPAVEETHEPTMYSVASYEGEIGMSSFSWYQEPGYQYYRITIINTSNGTIKCVPYFPKIPLDGSIADKIATSSKMIVAQAVVKSMLASIPPGKKIALNNICALSGYYRLEFTYDTSTNVSPGTILVEASTDKF